MYCEIVGQKFGIYPVKKRCRFRPIRDSDFFSSEVSDLPGRKRLSHGKRFNAAAEADSAMQCNAMQCKAKQCIAMHDYHVAAAVKRNAAKSFAVVREKNLFFLLLSIDGFPPLPFSRHIG